MFCTKWTPSCTFYYLRSSICNVLFWQFVLISLFIVMYISLSLSIWLSVWQSTLFRSSVLILSSYSFIYNTSIYMNNMTVGEWLLLLYVTCNVRIVALSLCLCFSLCVWAELSKMEQHRIIAMFSNTFVDPMGTHFTQYQKGKTSR